MPVNLKPHEVLVFLQNPHFKEEELHLLERYTTDSRFRKEFLANTMTGRRLRLAFGETWWNGIYIDNANPCPSIPHQLIVPPNVEHMRRVAIRVLPRVVLLCGRTAQGGWNQLRTDRTMGPYIRAIHAVECPHPNAMGVTQDVLDRAAATIRFVTYD